MDARYITNGGFVCAHAMDAGEFGLLPSLHITPVRSTVDGNPVLEPSDKDIAITEEVFNFAVVIKFWGTRPPHEVVRTDISKC